MLSVDSEVIGSEGISAPKYSSNWCADVLPVTEGSMCIGRIGEDVHSTTGSKVSHVTQ